MVNDSLCADAALRQEISNGLWFRTADAPAGLPNRGENLTESALVLIDCDIHVSTAGLDLDRLPVGHGRPIPRNPGNCAGFAAGLLKLSVL